MPKAGGAGRPSWPGDRRQTRRNPSKVTLKSQLKPLSPRGRERPGLASLSLSKGCLASLVRGWRRLTRGMPRAPSPTPPRQQAAKSPYPLPSRERGAGLKDTKDTHARRKNVSFVALTDMAGLWNSRQKRTLRKSHASLCWLVVPTISNQILHCKPCPREPISNSANFGKRTHSLNGCSDTAPFVSYSERASE